MRAFEPQIPARDFDNRLYECLKNINGYLQQVDSAFGLIGRGLVPVAGAGAGVPGTTLGGIIRHSQLLGLDSDDHLQYLRLAGRTAGQIAHGSLGSGGSSPVSDLGEFTTQKEGTGGATWTSIALTNGAAVGNIIVLIVGTAGRDGSPTQTHDTLTDSKGNIWTRHTFESFERVAAPNRFAAASIWTTIVTSALVAGLDTLSVGFSGAVGSRAIESRVFQGFVGATVTLAGSAFQGVDVNSPADPPASLMVGSLASREYIFVRATSIADNNTSYTASSGYAEVTPSHGNATTAHGTIDDNVGIRGEFVITTGTSSTSGGPTINLTNLPMTLSILVALQVNGGTPGSLILFSGDDANASKIAMLGSTITANFDFFNFQDIGTTSTLSYIRGSDGAFVGPIVPTPALDHGGLAGLGDDDHTQYLLLDGRTGGQYIGAGTAPTSGGSDDISTYGRLYVGTSTYDTDTFVSHRIGSFKSDYDLTTPFVTTESLNRVLVNLTGTGAGGGLTFFPFQVSLYGGAGLTSGVVNAVECVNVDASVTIPAGVTWNNFVGFGFTAAIAGDGNVGTEIGCDSFAVGSSGSGTATSIIGVRAAVTSGAMAVTSLIGFEARGTPGFPAPSGSTTTAIAFEIQGSFANSTTVATWYGFRHQTGPSAAITNKWSLSLETTSGTITSRIAHPIAIGWLPATTAAVTARLMLAAGTAAASHAPFKFQTGVNLTVAEAGAMEWDGSRLYITDTTPARKTIAYTNDTATLSQTEIDFGSTPVSEASFIVTDANVTASSQLIGSVAYEAPTGKDLDELEMDGLDLKFAPGAGQFTLYARGLDGYVADTFKINYLIG